MVEVIDRLRRVVGSLILEKVIPRLMRPLETGRRNIQPCLVHSDIWLGNVKPDAETEQPIIFDSCAFWGHNEGN